MCDERRAGLERPHYITNVLKAGGRTVHWKIALNACTIGADRVFSNLLQTKKIENRDLSINRQSPSAAESSQTKSVCTHVCTPICTPLCNTGATVANNVRPLSGVLDPGTFARVKVDLGRCDVCGTGKKAVYRSREAQAKVCEGCYARLVREWNAGAGVR